jgi:hypothetical protein
MLKAPAFALLATARQARLKAQSTKASFRFNNIHRLHRLTQIEILKKIMFKTGCKIE